MVEKCSEVFSLHVGHSIAKSNSSYSLCIPAYASPLLTTVIAISDREIPKHETTNKNSYTASIFSIFKGIDL